MVLNLHILLSLKLKIQKNHRESRQDKSSWGITSLKIWCSDVLRSRSNRHIHLKRVNQRHHKTKTVKLHYVCQTFAHFHFHIQQGLEIRLLNFYHFTVISYQKISVRFLSFKEMDLLEQGKNDLEIIAMPSFISSFCASLGKNKSWGILPRKICREKLVAIFKNSVFFLKIILNNDKGQKKE